MSFSFDVKINSPVRVVAAIKLGQFALAQAVIKDSNYYIPTDEHYLEESAIIHSDMKNGMVVWQTPYARRLYYNPQYDFSTDINPNASGLWFEFAKSQHKDAWIEKAEKVVRSKL